LWGKLSFQLRADHIFPRARVPPDMQYIRFTADLAVLHITMFAPGRRVNRGLIPLSTPGTLESTDHANIYRTRSYRWDGVAPGIEPVLQHVPPQFFSVWCVSFCGMCCSSSSRFFHISSSPT